MNQNKSNAFLFLKFSNLCLPLSLWRTLAMFNKCDNVPFSILRDVSLYLADALVIKSSLWNHWTSNTTVLSTSSSNQADFPSRNASLLLLNWSIIGTSKRKLVKKNLGISEVHVPYCLSLSIDYISFLFVASVCYLLCSINLDIHCHTHSHTFHW